MLVNMKKVYEIAERDQTAVGSFNYTNLESLHAIIRAAEKNNYPVFLSHAPVHDVYNEFEFICPLAIELARKSSAMICVHLDHGTDVDYIKRAIDMGFTSVMFDGSHLPYEENIRLAKEVVAYAKPRNVTVEAELGRMPSEGMEEDLGEKLESAEDYYTNPDQAKDFIERTGIDCLAISFGTVHGEYKSEPKLNFDIIKKVRSLTNNFPLVMHGGSGVSEEDYYIVIEAGIRKINYYTYMQIAGYKAVEELVLSKKTNQFHDIAKIAEEAMYQNILNAMKVFSRKK